MDIKKGILLSWNPFFKFNEKIKALEEYDLSKEEKEVLKMFAYRFLKIDFEPKNMKLNKLREESATYLKELIQ